MHGDDEPYAPYGGVGGGERGRVGDEEVIEGDEREGLAERERAGAGVEDEVELQAPDEVTEGGERKEESREGAVCGAVVGAS